ncbi:uncharacterized protein VTP21DRAFT_3356 [Calcarisporiella thermophila]|uniref:uncharacterized protein n=1 Tax=Calcarisporiella thermophila TaxID=911321 RepID=UPI003742DA7F
MTLVPSYVFRGHTSQVNTILFTNDNRNLISGDADGYIIVWNLKTRRPLHRFRGHEDSIIAVWPLDGIIISQGRDNKLKVWELEDSASEPIRMNSPQRTIPVNSLNFCSFSLCCGGSNQQLIALPGLERSDVVDIFDFNEMQPLFKNIGEDVRKQTGLCMAIRLFKLESFYLLLVAYESGNVILWKLMDNVEKVWSVKEHSGTALGLDVSSDCNWALSCGEDDKIVKYSLVETDKPVVRILTVKHAGVSNVKIRSDGRIFGTAGWDGKVRIFSSKTFKPLAILSYHTESVYALAFTNVLSQEEPTEEGEASKNWVAAAGKDERISLWQIY